MKYKDWLTWFHINYGKLTKIEQMRCNVINKSMKNKGELYWFFRGGEFKKAAQKLIDKYSEENRSEIN